MARRFAFLFLLIAFALAGEIYAADSSSPSPPTTTSTTTVKSPPELLVGNNSTDGTDYSDYEVPINLAPGGVEVVEDYAPFNTGRGHDELSQPEDDLKIRLRLAPKDRPVNPRRSRRSPPRVIQRCWPATCNWTSGRARVKCPYWARRPSRATSPSGGPRTLDLPKKG
uniref:Uncharacterized protein n=1 Tax=Brassica oleracea var. oleracea TaxID=109376 RepID=A0A0D3C091_BRAOL